MKSMKKFVSILLCMVLLLSVMPVISFSAAETLTLNTAWEIYLEYEEYLMYTFKPSSSGYYRLLSWGNDDPFVEVYDSSDNLVAEFDDCYGSYNLNCIAYLTKGKTYTYYVGSYDGTTYTNLYFEKLDPKNATTMVEGDYYEVEFENEFSTPQLFKFVPETDGYYGFYSIDSYDAYGYVYDSDMNLIFDQDDGVYGYDFYIDPYLFAGETYYFEAGRCWIEDEDGYITGVEKTDVIEDIEIVSYPDDTTVVDGYIYDTLDFSGLVLNLYYSDGSVEEWSYDYDDVYMESNLKFDWYYDDEYNLYAEIYTSYGYATYPLELVDNPVESISVESCPEIVLYEGYDGVYDEDMGAYYYYYDMPYNLYINVNYTDGTSETLGYYEDKAFYYYDDQWYYPWEIGKNVVYINYMGAETYVEVEVKEYPIENITLNSAPSAIYAVGDPYYGWTFDTGEFWLFPYNLEGISITVDYTDGTSETYDNSDVDYMELTIGGLPFEMNEIYVDEPGAYYAEMHILDETLVYEIEVIPEILLGDVDDDDVVSVIDATTLQRYAAKLEELTKEQVYIGDVDKDNVISVMDATRIQMYIAKKISDEDFFYDYY